MADQVARTIDVPRRLISVSRRTDVPAFYASWFKERLRAGFCRYTQPFGGTVHEVSLHPEDCIGIVFWTRYGVPLIPMLPEIRGRAIPFYFLCTLTGYPDRLETHGLPAREAEEGFARLSDAVSAEAVHWRYDPIVLSNELTPDWHRRNFERLARRLRGKTRRCHVSFVDFYTKTRRNLAAVEARNSERFRDPEPGEKLDLAHDLQAVAQAAGIRLETCCETLMEGAGIEAGSCVNVDGLKAVDPAVRDTTPPRPSRAGCRCRASVDIGAYNTCLFGCAYCYATTSREAALARHAGHEPEGEFLCRPSRVP